MFRNKFLIGALVAAVAAMIAPAKSEAAFKMRLTDTVTLTTVEILDGNADGIITFNGTLGGTSTWTVNITTSRSKPNVGSASNPELRLSTTNMSSAGGGTLKIEVSDTDFGTSSSPIPFTIISNSADANTGTVATSLFIDLGNGDYASATQVGVGLSGSGVFNVSEVGNATTDLAFSLNLITTVTHTGSSTSQFDSSVASAVPAPAGLVLIATAVPFLALFRRKMRKPEVTTAA
jgi:hypothetical protein